MEEWDIDGSAKINETFLDINTLSFFHNSFYIHRKSFSRFQLVNKIHRQSINPLVHYVTSSNEAG
jgi:hypothetical protein